MTKKLTIIFVLSIMAGLFFIENRKLNHKIEEAQKINEIQRINQDMQEMRSHLASKSVSSNLALNYESWLISNEIAAELYLDSDGKFEKEWGLFLGELAQQHNVDPYIVYELLKTETGGTFDPELVGPKTQYGPAYGLAQFMKNTAPWIAEMAELPYRDELLHDPFYSIELSVHYLNFLYSEYEDWDYALTAYHRGMGGLETYIARNGHAMSDYATTIQERATEFDGVAFVD
jgi:soluble lytic murein transglycosylase-like protein